MLDPIRGAHLQTRHLLLAMGAGDLQRVARALPIEAMHIAAAGQVGEARVEHLLRLTHALAARASDPYSLALAQGASGICAWLLGRWRDAVIHCDASYDAFRAHCSGVEWETGSVRMFGLWARYFLGDLREMARLTRSTLEEAHSRGDLYSTVGLTTSVLNMTWLAEGDVAEALRNLLDSERRWTHEHWQLQHYWIQIAHAHVDLYEGEGLRAWSRLKKWWPRLSSSMFLRLECVRVESLHLRGRCALAAVVESASAAERDALLREASSAAARLERERRGSARAFGALLRAGIAAVRHEDPRPALASAVAALEEASMALFAAAARRRMGDEQSAADRWMADQGIRSPARMTALLVPGWPD
jgi:hypothetical protein